MAQDIRFGKSTWNSTQWGFQQVQAKKFISDPVFINDASSITTTMVISETVHINEWLRPSIIKGTNPWTESSSHGASYPWSS